MSGNGEERWRSSRGQQSQGQPFSQQQKSNDSRKLVSRDVAPNASSNNASMGGNNAGKTDGLRAVQDHQGKAFDAGELRAFFKKAFDAGVATNPKPEVYKPSNGHASNRPGGAWGSKPNLMANGKDFWVDFRRQVTALQQIERAGG